MRYVQINIVPNGSTGTIMMTKHRELLLEGVDSYVLWGRGREANDEREYNFGSKAGSYLDVVQTRLDGKAGFHSRAATKRLLAKLDEIDPDVVHLHNIHGYYVNIEMLFNWLLKRNQKTRWTLHDCWAFTGHCAYFTYVGCAQWQTSCVSVTPCPQLNTYPKTCAKNSCSWNFARKRDLFTSLDNLTIITPSQWLADLVKKSFLADYPIEVQRNTIDTSVFKPTLSGFRKRHNIGDRFMVLGVASPWTERKGLREFVRLAGELDSSQYAIVLIGLSEKQIRELSGELIALPKTDHARQLAEAYSAADVFVHSGIEETFGMTVAEAQACGTPVIVAQGTACAEIADPAYATIVPADMSTLVVTVLKMRKEGSDAAC